MISEQDIEHIAVLARLHVPETDRKGLSDDLSHILEYVGKLKEVDTANVEPTAQIAGMENIFRDDAGVAVNTPRADFQSGDFLIEQAPQRDGAFIKVKSILKHK